MPENIIETLDRSQDPKELARAAATFAHSEKQEDHQQLLARLQSKEFLLRLDSEASYSGWPKQLNLRQVLDELSRGQPQPAHATLLALTKSEVFIKEPARVDLLIEACTPIRPAPPELIKFWDAHCQPLDGFGNLAVEAIVNNGSAPAIVLLAAKLRDARFEDDEKLNWMRASILTHRNDPILLEACEDLLQRGLSDALRLNLAEVLFDFRPNEWFTPATILQPPSRATLPKEVRARLERMAEFTLATLRPPEPFAAKIKSELEGWRRADRSS